ncbi:Dolichyl-diphosphooligosaccharide--protein glycosyltransferase subunit 1 [Mycena indigotica]|uniref:Dolichyl-diphosphooligosaccharide--protein glycosyltransferase subunit 1 n=1 Tax=Mycena indigotica TaxID=2126181 RepID=A0A8H6W4P0_9AGAR|nr:Dolichyl-diphosphooligosaccharide--protein glycosyltransferase subunit 1 [Mycena indigotica]KAF7301668.1 Dolichyl-diphosphooligosaccharide--protein glycosyltransferase subunit 1 [Mycena indigotica]
MLRRWAFLSFSLLGLASADTFENTAIVRTIELGGSLVQVTKTYAVKALESNANHYTIALSETEKRQTSWLEAKIKGQPQALTITERGVDSNGLYLVDISLPQAPSVGSSTNIVVESVLTHSTYPWPETAAQNEEQSLKHETDLFVLSPYRSAVQRTKIKSPSPNIHSYTTPENLQAFTHDATVTKSGATVTYGPYNNIPVSTDEEFVSKQQKRVVIHYVYDFPVAEIPQLHRYAEVSHWGGNLNIEDHIHLRNSGPALKGHFSRLEHQTQTFYKRTLPHVIPGMTLHLPAGIRNTYYYDLNGNVSTSRLRTAPSVPRSSQVRQYSVLELRPRFPIMGGWNYSFTLGWDSPLEDSTGYDKRSGKYILQVPVLTPMPATVVNNAEVTIILPEGATDVEFATPFPATSSSQSTHVTYLDTVGRPAVTLNFKDLTEKHALPIYVSYKVPLSAHLKKPIAVAIAFLSIFAFGLTARRVDLRIHKS